MLKVIQRKKEQKELYFQLSSIVNDANYGTGKVPAVYAIYKGETCFYVGQSGNISSRLATHLNGKFKNATKILIFMDGEGNGEKALLENEKYLIRLLNPIENILVNNDDPLDSSLLFYQFKDLNASTKLGFGDKADITILHTRHELVAFSSEIYPIMYEIEKDIANKLESIITCRRS
jgi:hypothetical protein